MAQHPYGAVWYFADISLFLAGELPKELGKLVKLTYFNVADNGLEGGLSTHTERFGLRDLS